MGYDIYWSLRRDTGLDTDERRRAAAHVARWRNLIIGYDLALPATTATSIDGLVAWCSLRPSHGDPRRRDHGGHLPDVIERVLDALVELRELFPGVEMRVADDFWPYGWAEGRWQPAKRAPAADLPAQRDGWVWASDLPRTSQPIPSAARPLCAAVGDERAIATAVKSVAKTDPVLRAGWMDALAARLALDGWEPRPWTAKVLDALVEIEARAAWRTLALAADAGLRDAAWALSRIVDPDTCVALGEMSHPAWATFARLVGFPALRDGQPTGEMVPVAVACDALANVGGLIPAQTSLDLDDDDSDVDTEITDETRAKIVAAAEALRPLGIELDDDTRPLLAPSPGDTAEELDIALDVVGVALTERLAPFLIGVLDAEIRQRWRQERVALAGEAREMPDVAQVETPPLPTSEATVPASAPGCDESVIHELLVVFANEERPSSELIQRSGLPPRIADSDNWDRAKAILARLRELPVDGVGRALVACLDTLQSSRLRDACDEVLPRVIDDGIALRLVTIWNQAFERPWEYSSRVTDYLASVASHPVILCSVLDEIAGPDDGVLRSRTSSAFELLGHASQRRREATAAIIARLRVDRGRPRDVVGWRTDAYRALRKLDLAESIATAILELSELVSVNRGSELLELLANHDRGLDVLRQSIDIRELSRDATRALCRSSRVRDDVRVQYLEHPFWKLRLAAAETNPSWERSKAETFAVWRQVEQAGLPLSEDDRRELARITSDDAARTVAASIVLSPLPPLRDGLASPCADHRAWTLWAVDERLDVADAAARVLADELDIEMVAHGHMRTAARWDRWRTKLPELPFDRRGRLSWAREHVDAQLPSLLQRVRDDGAAAVAAELPRPYVSLSTERRRELEALERPLAERGGALLRDPVRELIGT